jgi:hypothetical protein
VDDPVRRVRVEPGKARSPSHVRPDRGCQEVARGADADTRGNSALRPRHEDREVSVDVKGELLYRGA